MTLIRVKRGTIENAAVAAQKKVMRDRNSAFEKKVEKKMNGFCGMFKTNRIHARNHVRNNTGSFDDWNIRGWKTLATANKLLDICSVSCSDIIDLDSNDASFVCKWTTLRKGVAKWTTIRKGVL